MSSRREELDEIGKRLEPYECVFNPESELDRMLTTMVTNDLDETVKATLRVWYEEIYRNTKR